MVAYEIRSSGNISASELGNTGAAQRATGKGDGGGPCSSSACSGGGYGGSGGSPAITLAGGKAYGKLVSDAMDLGSSGGSFSASAIGGPSGGAIKFEASMSLTLHLLL